MKEQYVQPPVTKEDIKCLCENHGTNESVVTELLSRGVHPDHVDEVLEIRDQLCDFWEEAPGQLHEDLASIEAIVRAYQATEGDLELLGQIVEITQEEASIERGTASSYGIRKHGVYTRTLFETTERYLKMGSLALEDPLYRDFE